MTLSRDQVGPVAAAGVLSGVVLPLATSTTVSPGASPFGVAYASCVPTGDQLSVSTTSALTTSRGVPPSAAINQVQRLNHRDPSVPRTADGRPNFLRPPHDSDPRPEASVSILAFKIDSDPQGHRRHAERTAIPPRQFHTDGRGLPKNPEPNWTGYSVGTWQNDTLVVETVGITTRAWLDGFGHPRSEDMRITERYRRRDFGHMDLEFSFEDPKYYTRPFGYKTTLTLLPDTEVLEYICTENQKLRVR